MLSGAGIPSTWATAVSEARELKRELISAMRVPVTLAATRGTAEKPRLAELPRGIVGVGYGCRITNGARADREMALRVYVREKCPRALLSRSELVPGCIDGTRTDVIAVGEIGALARPTPCGVSCGHIAVTAGTVGCLVQRTDETGDARYILSANHVLANGNEAAIGDPILEPSSVDGGTSPIARLTDYQPIDFAGPNRMDAAIAEVIVPGDVLPEIAGIGRVNPPLLEPALGLRVRKHGRTTLLTTGVVVDLAADIYVQFANGVAAFEDQIGIEGTGGAFALGGDSGALVMGAVGSRPVALLFAGGTGTMFANPIGSVLARFAVGIV